MRQSLELSEILTTTVREIQSFLNTDRVIVYQFDPDGSGEVIAEAVRTNYLPELYGLHFQSDDIPKSFRQDFFQFGVSSIINVQSGELHLHDSKVDDLEDHPQKNLQKRSVDPCHLQYLQGMGIQCSIVVPLIIISPQKSLPEERQLWGLLIVHEAKPRNITPVELQQLQWIGEEIAQTVLKQQLLLKTQLQEQYNSILKSVSLRLHSVTYLELQQALEEIVIAFSGAYGRLYLTSDGGKDEELYLYHGASSSPELNESHAPPLETHPAWQNLLNLQYQNSQQLRTNEQGIEPIACQDILQAPQWIPLASIFKETSIRGCLIIPLYDHSRLLGSLSIFRNAIEEEKVWAGYQNREDQHQLPLSSFQMWRESTKGNPAPWTPAEINLGKDLGRIFSTAIEQSRLYQQINHCRVDLQQQVQDRTYKLEKTLEIQNSLRRISDRLRSTLELPKILQSLVQEVQTLLNSDRVVIYRRNRPGIGEVVVEKVGENWQSVAGLEIPAECFPEDYTQLYQQGRVRKIHDVSTAELTSCHREFLESLQVRANLIVPISRGSQFWGLLITHQCSHPRTWTQTEISILQQLANQAAIAINQAELYEKSNEVATLAMEKAFELEHAAEKQQALFRVISQIRASLDQNAVFQTVVMEVRRLLDVDRVGIFRFGVNSNWREGMFISEDSLEGLPPILGIQVEDSCFAEEYAQDYQNGRFQAIDDIQKAGFQDCHLQILAKFQVRANLAVPILKGKSLWGLLCLHECFQSRHWEESEIEFVKQTAIHLGVAIQQSSLLHRTQRQADALSKAYERLKKTRSQMIQQEKMSSLGQLVAGVAHEINNPVNFIYGNLNHLEQYVQDLLDLIQCYHFNYPQLTAELIEKEEEIELEFLREDLPNIMKSIKIGAERIRKMVISLRNFSHHDRAEQTAIDLHEGLESTLLILQHRLNTNRNQPAIAIEKRYGELPQVLCYPGQLNQVFMNILSNAIDAVEEKIEHHNDPQYKSQITIQTQVIPAPVEEETELYILVEIQDNGSGIPDEIGSTIFDPFMTTKPIGKGTGLGLAISYQIVVEKHKGKLEYESQLGEGTTFKIHIPMNSYQ